MEKLLAWEKKIYEKVKAREEAKIKHEKKLTKLRRLEYNGKDGTEIEKTKSSIQKLQQTILDNSDAVASCSISITEICDNDLSSQLVNLCHSLLCMWREIHSFHKLENEIAQQIHGLMKHSYLGDSTSLLHLVATRDLEIAVSFWHIHFKHLIKYQHDYVDSIYGCLKVTTLSPVKKHSSTTLVKLYAFCDAWKQALDILPYTIASDAIKSFANAVEVICNKQEEEVKFGKRIKTYLIELDEKSSTLRLATVKKSQLYSTVGINITGHTDNELVFTRQDSVGKKEHEIALFKRKVEDEKTKYAESLQITRLMTMNYMQTGLPSVFQAMAGFSRMFTEAMEGFCTKRD